MEAKNNKYRKFLLPVALVLTFICVALIALALHDTIGTRAPYELSDPIITTQEESLPVMEQSDEEQPNEQSGESSSLLSSKTEESSSEKTANGTTEKNTANNGATLTGFVPLSTLPFKVEKPADIPKLSTKKIAHSYGVATGGKPHQISIDTQNFFDSKGYKAIVYDKKSSDKLLYMTFDAGYENGVTSGILDTLKEKNVPAAFFCTLHHIKSEPQLIARMITEGHIIGNHSVKHPDFTTITRARMIEEIQGFDNYLRENFGYSAPYFRFPEGAYSENALDLVQSLGYTSVFWSVSWADWDVNNQQGGKKAFDTITSRLHPGAIILLHSVSKDNADALGDIIDWARKQGYEFAKL